jgi:hypothetical protein
VIITNPDRRILQRRVLWNSTSLVIYMSTSSLTFTSQTDQKKIDELRNLYSSSNWVKIIKSLLSRSQCPRSLRCGSAAARLLGLRVQIPPGQECLCECCVCCQVEVPASGWSLVQRSPTECDVPKCDREASIMWRHWPTRDVAPWKKNHYYLDGWDK